MRFAIKILVIICVFNSSFAQAPQAIPFQGAVRNANNVLLSNKTITVRFSIRNGFSFGNIIYREWQTTVTNSQGLFVLNVGQGNIDIGQFSTINWSDSLKFMQVEIDTTNSKTVWRDIGTQQMLSVPFALNARKADSANVASNGVPVGTVEAFAGDTSKIPNGWLLCDGRKLVSSSAQYANLFNVIGYIWGGSQLSGFFQVPSTAGLFLRGASNGPKPIAGLSETDPDRLSRIAIGAGGTGNIGDKVGSLELDAFQGHKHRLFAINNSTNGSMGLSASSGNNTGWTAQNTMSGYDADEAYGSPRLSAETRPMNVYINYIIKY